MSATDELREEAYAEAALAKAAFQRRDFESAAMGFGRAIELHEEAAGPLPDGMHLLHCNHSAALALLGFNEASLAAARRSVDLGGASFVKGIYRAALALVEMERWDEAAEACEAALVATPDSTQLQQLLDKCRHVTVQRTEAQMLQAALPKPTAPTPAPRSTVAHAAPPVMAPTPAMAAAAAVALDSEWAAARERSRAARDQRESAAKSERENLEAELKYAAARPRAPQ